MPQYFLNTNNRKLFLWCFAFFINCVSEFIMFPSRNPCRRNIVQTPCYFITLFHVTIKKICQFKNSLYWKVFREIYCLKNLRHVPSFISSRAISFIPSFSSHPRNFEATCGFVGVLPFSLLHIVVVLPDDQNHKQY